MKYLLFIFTAILAFSCTEKPEEDNLIPEKKEEVPVGTPEEQVVRYFKTKLNIIATESYDYTIHKAHLDSDDSLDWVVSINLLDRALDQAVASGKAAKRAEMGYIGNFNFFVYMDGMTKKIVGPVIIPSSPQAPLDVKFDNIITDKFKSFTVDFRIRSMKRRRFYSVYNGIPQQVCESVIFDNIDQPNGSSFVVEYEDGTYSRAKDIVEYVGDLNGFQATDQNTLYEIDPEIKKTNKVAKRWYYNPNTAKYFLRKDEL